MSVYTAFVVGFALGAAVVWLLTEWADRTLADMSARGRELADDARKMADDAARIHEEIDRRMAQLERREAAVSRAEAYIADSSGRPDPWDVS